MASGSTPIQSYPMPPASADLATTWAFLEEGVDHIMTKLQTGVSYSKYMSLYTVAYNYCTSSKMPSSTGTSDLSTPGRSACFIFSPQIIGHSRDLIIFMFSAGANLVGSDLYNNLIRYFVQHLKGLKDVRRARIY